MKYIRIGNDIHIEWIILRNMQPESFTNKEVTVKLYDKNGLPQNFEFTKNGSSIVGTFYGKDQSTTGNYRLELVENAGKSNMVTLDYIDCFTLSAKLKNTTSSGNDSSYGIKTDVVNLASNINLGGSSTSSPADIDLSSYAKISYVDAKLALKANLSDIPQPVDTSNFALKSEIPNMTEYAKKSEIPSMDNVATKDEIPVIPEFKTINGNSIVGTGNITIEGGGQAYDDTEIRNLIASKQDAGDYALKSELPNLDDYALKSEIPTSTGLNEEEVNALIDSKLGEVETKLSEI